MLKQSIRQRGRKCRGLLAVLMVSAISISVNTAAAEGRGPPGVSQPLRDNVHYGPGGIGLLITGFLKTGTIKGEYPYPLLTNNQVCNAEEGTYTFSMDVNPQVVMSSDGSLTSEYTSFIVPKVKLVSEDGEDENGKPKFKETYIQPEFELLGATRLTGVPEYEEFKEWALEVAPNYIESRGEDWEEILKSDYELYKNNFHTVKNEAAELNIALKVGDANSIEEMKPLGADYNEDPNPKTPYEYLLSSQDAIESTPYVFKSDLFDKDASGNKVEDKSQGLPSDYVDTYTLGVSSNLYEKFLEEYNNQSTPVISDKDGSYLWTGFGDTSFADLKREGASTSLDVENLLGWHGYNKDVLQQSKILALFAQHLNALKDAKGSVFEGKDTTQDFDSMEDFVNTYWQNFTDEERTRVLEELQSVIDTTDFAEMLKASHHAGITVRVKYTVPLETARALGSMPIYYQNTDHTLLDDVEIMSPFYTHVDSARSNGVDQREKPIKSVYQDIQEGKYTWSDVLSEFVTPGDYDTLTDDQGLLHASLFNHALISVDHLNIVPGANYAREYEADPLVVPFAEQYNLAHNPAVTYIVDPKSDLRNMVLVPFNGDACPTPETPTPAVPIIPVPFPVPYTSTPPAPSPTEVPKKERGMLANTGSPLNVIALSVTALMLAAFGLGLSIRRKQKM